VNIKIIMIVIRIIISFVTKYKINNYEYHFDNYYNYISYTVIKLFYNFIN